MGSACSINGNQDYFLRHKGGRCVELTTLPPSFSDCLELWEPEPPGTLRARLGLCGDCFTFHKTVSSSNFVVWGYISVGATSAELNPYVDCNGRPIVSVSPRVLEDSPVHFASFQNYCQKSLFKIGYIFSLPRLKSVFQKILEDLITMTRHSVEFILKAQ